MNKINKIYDTAFSPYLNLKKLLFKAKYCLFHSFGITIARILRKVFPWHRTFFVYGIHNLSHTEYKMRSISRENCTIKICFSFAQVLHFCLTKRWCVRRSFQFVRANLFSTIEILKILQDYKEWQKVCVFFVLITFGRNDLE